MENKKGGQLIIIGVLAVAILFMSVGFAAAAYNANLNINGEVTVQPARWSVHWDTTSYSADANSVAITQTAFTTTGFSFTATLTQPGDYAQFTIDAINDGTLDANLTGITLSSIASYADYLTYEVTYGSNTYTTSATGLSTLLAATNGREHVTVKVAYTTPADSADLPQSAVTVNLSAAFAYESVV